MPGGRLIAGEPVQILCGAIGVFLLVVTIVAGYAGSGTALDNWAPTFILITFWVGLVFASILFGDIFPRSARGGGPGGRRPPRNRPDPGRGGASPRGSGRPGFP